MLPSTTLRTVATAATTPVSKAASASTKCWRWMTPSAPPSAKADTTTKSVGLAQDSGMKLMQEYALEHVRAGITTIEEVQRVVPFAQLYALLCTSCRRELSSAFQYCPHCGKKQTSGKAAKVKKAAQVPARSDGLVSDRNALKDWDTARFGSACPQHRRNHRQIRRRRRIRRHSCAGHQYQRNVHQYSARKFPEGAVLDLRFRLELYRRRKCKPAAKCAIACPESVSASNSSAFLNPPSAPSSRKFAQQPAPSPPVTAPQPAQNPVALDLN